jgi:hypothetical protein
MAVVAGIACPILKTKFVKLGTRIVGCTEKEIEDTAGLVDDEAYWIV